MGSLPSFICFTIICKSFFLAKKLGIFCNFVLGFKKAHYFRPLDAVGSCQVAKIILRNFWGSL